MKFLLDINTEAEARSVRAGLANWINNLHHRMETGKRVDDGPEKICAAQAVLNRLDTLIDSCTSHRFLLPGEIIQDGDELLLISRFGDPHWGPCRATVGHAVLERERGDFRRAV